MMPPWLSIMVKKVTRGSAIVAIFSFTLFCCFYLIIGIFNDGLAVMLRTGEAEIYRSVISVLCW